MAEVILDLESAAWGPTKVGTTEVALLSDLTGLSADAVVERLRRYQLDEMASAWTAAAPRSPAEIRQFYEQTEHYLWELLCWHGSEHYSRYVRRVGELIAKWPPSQHPRALDYGSGVGTTALQLARAGYEVTIADVPGRTFEFARARLERHGYKAEALPIEQEVPDLPRARYDVLVCFDVLEHLPAADKVARKLVESLRRRGGMAIVASFDATGEEFPHHLASGQELFGGDRWAMFLHGLGTQRVGDLLYRRVSPAGAVLRRLNYLLYMRTGFAVQQLER